MTIHRSQGGPGSFISVVILILIIALASCSSDTVDEALVVALAQEPPTLDIQVNSSISGRMIALGNVYEKPVVLDGEGRIRCELASSFELSEDEMEVGIGIHGEPGTHKEPLKTADEICQCALPASAIA